MKESIVENAALTWFGELGYGVGHGPQLAPGEVAAERDSFGEVVLVGRLREAIRRLNPAIPEEAREEALRKVLRVGTPSLTQTNRAFHRMLRDGVPVEYPRPDGSIAGDHVRLIDFDDPAANDWLAVNQFTVIEGQHNRRPDLVVFVNGLPVGWIELKNAADEDATIWSAYAQLQTYTTLLHYNAALVVSDGLQARMGFVTFAKNHESHRSQFPRIPQEVAAVRHPHLPADLLVDGSRVPPALGRHFAHWRQRCRHRPLRRLHCLH